MKQLKGIIYLTTESPCARITMGPSTVNSLTFAATLIAISATSLLMGQDLKTANYGPPTRPAVANASGFPTPPTGNRQSSSFNYTKVVYPGQRTLPPEVLPQVPPTASQPIQTTFRQRSKL